jgi:hypothetical protein
VDEQALDEQGLDGLVVGRTVTGWSTAPGPGAGADFRRRPRALVIVAVVLVLVTACGLAARMVIRPGPPCQASFVPAFFPPADWNRVSVAGASPAVMILNPASGPGARPDPEFRQAVKQAMANGSRVIGYVGTNYGQRPLWQSEQYISDYRKWYGVRGIFLDQAPTSGTQQIGYYRALARYIHTLNSGAPIWLNPGVYPDRAYMKIASVVMVFEGSYQSYLGVHVPRWVRHYRPDRFAHTVYAATRADLAGAIKLSRDRRAGYLYVTDDVTPNPYSALPHYWGHEEPTVAANCSSH